MFHKFLSMFDRSQAMDKLMVALAAGSTAGNATWPCVVTVLGHPGAGGGVLHRSWLADLQKNQPYLELNRQLLMLQLGCRLTIIAVVLVVVLVFVFVVVLLAVVDLRLSIQLKNRNCILFSSMFASVGKSCVAYPYGFCNQNF